MHGSGAFLSAVLLRMSFYAVWHVAYGNFRWEWGW
jgi:hypothetical protein